MRIRFLTAAMAVAVAIALVAAFGTAAAARRSVRPKSAHRGDARVFVTPSVLATLYDQNDNDSGIGVLSQNFETSLDAYDSQGADDFRVRTGVTWRVREVDVTGVYFNGSGLALSENVTFYKNAGGLPGAVEKSYTGVVGADNGTGSFVITLPTAARLTSGKYWVSVQANMDYTVGGEWGWETRTVQSRNPAAWQNPADGFATGCITWGVMTTCVPAGEGPDLMFGLRGTKTLLLGPGGRCRGPINGVDRDHRIGCFGGWVRTGIPHLQ
jgi:hypothetical protein